MLRISLGELLLLVPAYGVAFVWGAFLEPRGCTLYTYMNAVNGIRSTQLDLNYAEEWDAETLPEGGNLSDDTLRRWLAKDLSPAELKTHGLYEYVEFDPWHRPYQFTRLDHGPNADGYLFEVYSLGRDGVSATHGNDPDDINSWDPTSSQYYRDEIDRAERRKFALRGLLLTIPVYLALLALLRLARRNRPKVKQARVESEAHSPYSASNSLRASSSEAS